MAIAVFLIVFLGITLTQNVGKSQQTITTENANRTLDRLNGNIDIEPTKERKGNIDLSVADKKDSLPPIKVYPILLDSKAQETVEIFSSPEKAGTETDRWFLEMAKDFNRTNPTVGGKSAGIKIRKMDSGTGMDYIATKTYLPDAYSPSNELWGNMLTFKGAKIKLLEKRLAGNVPGILLSKTKQDELVKKYGSINLKTITEAVSKNEIAMGYTNPFASSSGLNLLVSALSTFDKSNPLGEKAVQGFEKFQTNIPFTALTTMQMRDSAKSGALDGFILEYQTYNNSPDLKSYVFNPYGVRHDSPIYEIGTLSPAKQSILKQFIAYCKSEKGQKLASSLGFNKLDNYKSEMGEFSGQLITDAQKLWKEKKGGNNSVSAVFVADTSGSMEGDAMNKLKSSLLKGSKFIGKENSIGLVSFSDNVRINLPIRKFDITQRAYFAGAVEDLQANGKTAMFDGIIVATKMLLEQRAKNPNEKLMLFVLSDGETNVGHNLDDVQAMLKAYKIPIYTIGYNADIKVMEQLSGINEAAAINAQTDDVVYKIENLFNAQM